MNKWFLGMALGMIVAPRGVLAADYKVEAVKEAAPAGQLSAEVRAQLSPLAYKVTQGEKRLVCEIWLANAWSSKADFQASDTVQYPLEVGSLIGALRFARKGADFRGQDIAAGVYVLRYANQPVDGNHVGTFETRDFLVMLPASADQSAGPVAEMDLFKTSAQSAESSHPAIMPLVKPAESQVPSLRHLEDHDWWTLRLDCRDAKGTKLALEVIVVGKAAE